MARDKGWIGKYCSAGDNFNTRARTALALPIGDVFYVDLAGGSDGNTGESFDTPMLTVNAAYDKLTADKNDYVVVTGWKTETGTGVIASLDVAQTHLIGHCNVLNPYYQEKGTFYRTGAGDAPHTRVAAEFVEVAGLSFLAVQSSGTQGSGVSKGGFQIGTLASAGANKAFVHNIMMPDWNTAANITGITATGHYLTLRDIVIDNVYGNFDTGIRFDGASNSAYSTIENLYCQGGVAGDFNEAIYLDSGARLQNSRINGLYAQRCAVAIALGAAVGGYTFVDNAVVGCSEAVFFSGAAACDARDDLWTQYKWTVGENVSGNDAKFQDS